MLDLIIIVKQDTPLIKLDWLAASAGFQAIIKYLFIFCSSSIFSYQIFSPTLAFVFQ